ncbi:MAG: sulfotransferase, partial [Sphingomicrobium sp.]
MAGTGSLERCDYVRQIMAEIGGVWGRSRFMGLAPGREVPPHIDINYYWRTHLRIHIPVITNPGVLFTCGDETVHMAAGECWVFDSFLRHDVQNKGEAQRIHLVLDTVGGGILPELMNAADAGGVESRVLRPGERPGTDLRFEKVNSPQVMSPWEMRCHLAFTREKAGSDPQVIAVLDRVESFIDAWAANWAQFATNEAGRAGYERLLNDVREAALAMGVATIEMPNQVPLARMLDQLIFLLALAPANGPVAEMVEAKEAAQLPPRNSMFDLGEGVSVSGSVGVATPSATAVRERFDRPIFIVSTPRSGSTLLYETLVTAPGLFATGDESHQLIESVPGLSPQHRGWLSNQLVANDASPERAAQLAEAFYRQLRDRGGRRPTGRVRMLEKTPKNALRVPFFDAIWPDAHFIYLYRDPRETLYSMMEAWRSGAFRTYPALPGWTGEPWSLLLIPGWQELKGMELPQVVAHQWAITTEVLLDDLERLGKGRVQALNYVGLVDSAQLAMEGIAAGLSLEWDRHLGDTLPLSKTTVSRPDRQKWRQLEDVIQAIMPIVEKADARARQFIATRAVNT